MDHAERILLTAAAGYAKHHNISMTKMAWALSSILQKPENNVYYKLNAIHNEANTDLLDAYGINAIADCFEPVDEVDEDVLESRVGEVVTVEVLDVKTFGVICRVEDTTRTLLLHLSEIAHEFINDVSQYFKKGDKIKAILVVNPKGELGLSAKRINTVSNGTKTNA